MAHFQGLRFLVLRFAMNSNEFIARCALFAVFGVIFGSLIVILWVSFDLIKLRELKGPPGSGFGINEMEKSPRPKLC